jgi:hypothetical protein
LIRDTVSNSSKLFFAQKKEYDSLKLVNKFIYSSEVQLESDKIVEQFFKTNKSTSEDYNFGKFYPFAPTPIDEDGLLSAFDNRETTFIRNVNEKESSFIWPTLYSKNFKLIENCAQVVMELNPKIIYLSNY